MVKDLIIDPQEVRQAAQIAIPPIPVNQYRGTLSDEISAHRLTTRDGVRVYRDMLLIRRFEEMLGQIKKLGSFQTNQYDHKGPDTITDGREAEAVGGA